MPESKDSQAFPRGYFDKAVLDPPVEFYPVGDQFTKHTYPDAGEIRESI